MHRGQFRVDGSCLDNVADPTKLSAVQREAVDIVLRDYGDKSPQWLSDLTHMEKPWREARIGIPEGDRAGSIIRKQDLAEYYGGLMPAG